MSRRHISWHAAGGAPPRIPRAAPPPKGGPGATPLSGGVPRLAPVRPTKPAPRGPRGPGGPRARPSRRRAAGPCDVLDLLRLDEQKMGTMYAHAGADPQLAAEQATLGQYQADAEGHAAGLAQAMQDRGCP